MADLARARKLTFPEFSATTSQALSELLGDRVHVSNPLDYHTYVWGDEPTLTDAFTALLREPLDCALLILDYPPPELYDVELWQVAERALCAASLATGTRVALVSSLPENFPSSARARLRELGVAPMQGLQECVQAIQHGGTIGRAQQDSESLVAIKVPVIDAANGHAMDELVSKNELANFGLAVPASARCSPQDAPGVAMSIGYPVVLKALGEQLAHKTELGAVRVGIKTAAEVTHHAQELGALSGELLIEAMVEDAVAELLVGVTHDANFGQVLVLGAGGVNVEMLRDTVQLLLPASRQQIGAALDSLRVSKLISGYRAKAGDVEAVLDAIESICAYASANRDCLLELDVNPLLVRPVKGSQGNKGNGKGVGDRITRTQQPADALAQATKLPGAIAVDALIRKSKTS